MEPLRLDAVAARVVAWHNRHPLARRITAAQVHTIGYVALPFVVPGSALPMPPSAPSVAVGAEPQQGGALRGGSAGGNDGVAVPEGGSLRERALARMRQQEEAAAAAREGAQEDAAASPASGSATAARPGTATSAGPVKGPAADGFASASASAPEAAETPSAPARKSGLPARGVAAAARATTQLRAAFVEDFVPPLAPRRVARWAATRACRLDVPPGDAPLRRVLPGGPAQGAPVTLYVLTAAIDAGGARTRVLLGTGASAAVLGRRLWSVPRSAAAVLAPLLLAGAAAGVRLQAGSATPGSDSATLAAEAAEAAVAAVARKDGPEAAASAGGAAAVATAAADAAEPVAAHGSAERAAGVADPAADATAGHPHADARQPQDASHPAAVGHGGDSPLAHGEHAGGVPGTDHHATAAAPAGASSAGGRPLDVEPRLGVIALPRLGRIAAAEKAPAAGAGASAASAGLHAPAAGEAAHADPRADAHPDAHAAARANAQADAQAAAHTGAASAPDSGLQAAAGKPGAALAASHGSAATGAVASASSTAASADPPLRASIPKRQPLASKAALAAAARPPADAPADPAAGVQPADAAPGGRAAAPTTAPTAPTAERVAERALDQASDRAAGRAVKAADPRAALRPDPGAATPSPSRGAAPALARGPAPRGDAAPAADGGVYAVSTRALRTRAEAEQVMAAMGALLRAGASGPGVRVEIVPQGADWRVVGWPYRRPGDADSARALLATRGLRVAVVDF